MITFTLNTLEYLNDYSLDNHYLLDIWGKVMYLLVNYKLFSYKDLERLKDLSDDQIDCIFSIACKSVIESGDENLLEGELLKLTFFKASKKLLIDKYAKLSEK